MKRKQVKQQPLARIIIDSRDASKDKFIPLADAAAAFDRGELARDITNSTPGNWAYSPVKPD